MATTAMTTATVTTTAMMATAVMAAMIVISSKTHTNRLLSMENKRKLIG